jgi:hypothetical protein
MGGRLLNFADLLGPFAAETFLEQNWEKEPLHLRSRGPGFYDNILKTRDVDAAISSGGLRFPAIQLAKDGGFFPPEAFTRNSRSGDDIFTGIPDLDRIRAEYERGASVSLPAFHRAWKPLGMLVAAIEEDFGHAVHANVYITPANAAGFASHYDTHEVFVLQIAGRKHWRIRDPSIPLPHRSQPYDPRVMPSAPARELELAPGDLLYLPRGFAHDTATSHSFSLHVTIGVTVYTWVELLAEWAQSSQARQSLRRALPPGFAGREEVKRTIRDQLPRIIAELQQTTDYDSLLDDFSRRIRAASARTQIGFHADVAVIGSRTRLRCPEADRYTVSDESARLTPAFDGRTLLLDHGVRSTLDEMRRRRTFSALDVSQHLGEKATLALIRSLHRERFLSTEPSSS